MTVVHQWSSRDYAPTGLQGLGAMTDPPCSHKGAVLLEWRRILQAGKPERDRQRCRLPASAGTKRLSTSGARAALEADP
jgi:hypothetical protein